ncbi:uncharacterized protein LOC115816211 [Chanos chanos]|uniref:Uncharacterized protein LOC115816211 n=1 Tax=Chanos chanos TaxID=29144 RepID=A0A6J2VSX4_CHACN|nr:uncharacterized protein LOC115816211 [Chanos chanos]
MTALYMPLLTYLAIGGALSIVHQMDPVLITQAGANANLSCFFPKDKATSVMWLKQTIGQGPVVIATSYYHTSPAELEKSFNKSKRFIPNRGIDSFNLSISKIEPADLATYYCAVSLVNKVTFGNGTLLVVKRADLDTHTILQEPVFGSFQPGDDLSLQCKIHANISTAERNIYWFRHGSGESHPGIIYTHGNRSDHCKKRSEAGSPTQSCVYHLPKRNLSPSDAGTYYCAVATCGQILYGNGTELNIAVSAENPSPTVSQPKPSLSAPLGGSVTLECNTTAEKAMDWIWLKQSPGQKLRPIVSTYYGTEQFQDEFLGDPHLELQVARESHPGIIYTHGNRSDQCEKSSAAGSPTQSCVYNLPMANISLSDAGTYYCAVATCGEILFGSGTRIEIEGIIIITLLAHFGMNEILDYIPIDYIPIDRVGFYPFCRILTWMLQTMLHSA